MLNIQGFITDWRTYAVVAMALVIGLGIIWLTKLYEKHLDKKR